MQEPETAKKRGGLVSAVLAAVAGVFGAFLVLEIGTRLILDDGMNFDLEMWKYARDIKMMADDEAIGHVHRPGSSGFYMGAGVAINSAGYRDREYDVAKPASKVRIIMLGDSLTFGWGVEMEDTFADQLEKLLNGRAAAGRYEVINSGVGNYNTSMEVSAFLHTGQKFKPDIVVLNYFINDAEPTPKRKLNAFTEYSYAAVMLWGAADTVKRLYFGKPDWKTYYAGLYEDGQPGWSELKDAMAALADYCRSNGISLLMVNFPELHELRNYPFASATAKLANVAASLAVPFHDTLPALDGELPETLWVSPTDAHPNAKADAIFAAEIRNALRANFPALITE